HCDVFKPGPDQQHWPWEQQQQQIIHWVNRLPKPVGVMCCNDDRGQQLLNACLLEGIQVPEEVAVIGVDNDVILCNLATPPLSSMDVTPRQRVLEAAAVLGGWMEGKKPPGAPIASDRGAVFTRHSSDILAIKDPDVAQVLRFIREKACEGIRMDDVFRTF